MNFSAHGPRGKDRRTVCGLRSGCLIGLLLGALAGPPMAGQDSAGGAGTGFRFIERAAEVGLEFVYFNGMSGELYFPEMTGGGLALFDYDRDGDLDLYLVQGRMLGDKPVSEASFTPTFPLPLTDRLYRNDLGPLVDGDRAQRFVDVTEGAGLGSTVEYGMGVAAGDFDGDGWVDLYVTNFGANNLLRNRGDGSFEDVTAASGAGDDSWSVSASFLDFDGDGWLDLYVGNYVDFRIATHKPCTSETGAHDYCGPLAYAPVADRLLRNRGDGTFEDVSARSGINRAFGAALGVVAGDFNGDSHLDVYVANDGTPNQLWLNQGDSRFVDDSLLSGTGVNEQGQPEASMGVVAADLDADGSEDLFMAHLTRETNTLYLNDGSGMFYESTRESGLGMSSWQFTGFGTVAADFDLDGLCDLFVANGAVKRIEAQLRANDPYPLRQRNQIFRNLGGARFVELTESAGQGFELSEVSRGAVGGDLDNDGDLDLVVSNSSGPVRLFENRSAAQVGWLGLVIADRDAAYLGATARFESSTPLQVRRFRRDGSFASARDARLILARSTVADERLVVRGRSGSRTSLALPGGRYYVLGLP